MKLSLVFVVSLVIFQSLRFDTADANNYDLIKICTHSDLNDFEMCWGFKGKEVILIECDDEDDSQIWKWNDLYISPYEKNKIMCPYKV